MGVCNDMTVVLLSIVADNIVNVLWFVFASLIKMFETRYELEQMIE